MAGRAGAGRGGPTAVIRAGISVLIVGLGGLLWAEAVRSRWRATLKIMASTGFVIVALGAGALDSTYGRWILVGLGLSWIGDAALLGRSDRAFLLGLGAFLLGHLAYVVAFLSIDLDPTTPAILFGLTWLAIVSQVARWLNPHVTGHMRTPVAAYVTVISAMVVLAGPAGVGRGSLLIPVGAVAFAVSDIAVARDRFVSSGAVNRMWGLPLYYVGQVLLSLSVA